MFNFIVGVFKRANMKKRLLLFLIIPMFYNQVKAQAADSVVLPNGALYYYVYGKGEPLVLLSGGPGGNGHNMDHMIEGLDKHYQFILFDQRGTGCSWTKPFDSTTINLSQAVEDLDLLRQKLKITKLNLLGRSWGCMLAAAYISRYPNHVRLFISVCGGGLDTSIYGPINANIRVLSRDLDSTRYRYWTNPEMIKIDSAKAAYELARLHMFTRVYDSSKIDLVINRQKNQGPMNMQMNRIMWSTLPKYLHLSDAGHVFKGKVLLIFGWEDPISLTTISQYMQAFPNAEVHGIYESGHFVETEQPAQFYSAVNNFLLKNRGLK